MAPKYNAQELARRQKDPGLRSKLPSKYLTPAQRAQREQNARLNAPVTPGSSYTNRMAAKESQAQVQQKYGQADQQLTEQLQRSQGVQSQIPAWYDQYRQTLQAQQQGQAQGYAQAAQQYQALQAGIQSQAAQGQQQVGDLQAEIQNLGGAADLGATQVAANAAAQRGAYAGNLGQVVAAQGANNAAYGAAQVGASGKSQLESLMSELDEERKVRSSQQTLAQEKGAFDLSNRQAITDRERKALLENKAFGLEAANTLQDNQNTADQIKQTARDKAAQRREQAKARGEKMAGPGGTYTAKEWREMSPEQRTQATARYNRETKPAGSRGAGGGAGAPRQEPASSIGVRRGINARTETVRKYMRDNNIPVRNGTDRARLVAALRQTHAGYFANPNEEKSLSAAIDLATGGKIQNATLRYLRKQGIYVTSTGGYWGGGNRGG
jgi:hypothetical protein